LDLFCIIPIRLSSQSRKKAASSQDGCVNYLTKQTLAGEWHHPHNTGMTYPKSEIRNKDCDRSPFAKPVMTGERSPSDFFSKLIVKRNLGSPSARYRDKTSQGRGLLSLLPVHP
jgi:hypothetical protein